MDVGIFANTFKRLGLTATSTTSARRRPTAACVWSQSRAPTTWRTPTPNVREDGLRRPGSGTR